MSLDGKLLARARENLARRKDTNAAETEKRRAEIYAAIPGVKNIDDELRGLFSRVLSAALSGEGGETLDSIEEKSLALCAEKAEILSAHGYAADYLEDIVSCRKCGDNGYTADGRPCSCLMELYEAEKAAELSSLTKMAEDSFACFSLDYYSGEAREMMAMVLDYCRRYAATFDGQSANLLFRGGTGLGKTFLSGCIAKTVSEKGCSVVYETAAEAFTAFEDQRYERSSPRGAQAAEKIERMLRADLFILDDLGTEMLSPWVQSALYQLINGRLISGKKTIISTNLSPAEMEKRYMPQICSRIEGEYDTLLFMGEDIRAIKKSRRYL